VYRRIPPPRHAVPGWANNLLVLPRQSLSLGSLATASRRRRQPQPVADLAYNPEDIKARLSAVNVYTVANKKNEFVLVSGEVRQTPFASDQVW